MATRHSARTLNLLHAFYGLGATTGPVIMTSVLVAGFAWQRGYAIVGLAQIALAACFAATRTLWPPPVRTNTSVSRPVPIHRTLCLPGARLGMLTFFLYTGMEATAGAWTFSLLAEGRSLPVALAGTAVSAYWGGPMMGRLAFGLCPPALVGVLAHATGLAAVPLALFSMSLALWAVYELLGRGVETPPVPQTVW